MKAYVNAVREATRTALGNDADLSYITEEELDKASIVDITVIRRSSWQVEGNSLTQYTDGHWEWYEGCDTKKRFAWNGALNYQRMVNCANGLIHCRISS